ncbi:MAG: HAMP domain-containing histidine kinase [Desulfamplus sp.]|nr:HAMP domain-containing histidine kinase [Desulfamplus sp.]
MKIRAMILDFIQFDSIETKLSSIAVVFIMGTAITMGCMGIWLTHKFVTQRFHDNFIVLSEYLARNAELGVLLKNSEMLENLTANMLQQEDIVKVIIKDTQGGIITETDRNDLFNTKRDSEEPRISSGLSNAKDPFDSGKSSDFNKLHNVNDKSSGSSEPLDSYKLTEIDEILDSAIKITTRIFQIQPDTGDMVMYGVNTNKEIIGYVELYYTPSGLKSLTKEMSVLFMAIALVLSFVSVAWYWFFSRSITSPLIDLVAVSRRVSKGDLDVRASGGDLRETRTLARVFNEMLNSVKAHQRETEKIHMEMAKQKSLAEIGKFSTMVAHELKNPISIIKGSMDIFKKKGLDEDIKKTMLVYVDEEIQRLNRLVDEFLMFAKPKTPVLSRLLMSSFIGEITEKFRFTVPDKNIKISVNIEDVPVECDGVLMERAILNILKNAVEHSVPVNTFQSLTPKSDEKNTTDRKKEEKLIKYDADIEVHGRLQGAAYVIEIKDRGKGIDQSIIDEIFNPFFTTRAKGTGLGLAIVRDIVAVHNGTVMVKNRPSGGASFEIKIMAHVVPSFFLK